MSTPFNQSNPQGHPSPGGEGTGMRRNYADAKAIADKVVYELKPHCQRIHIAGSIKRQKPEIGDIEIVCLPKKEKRGADLFGGGELVICSGFINAIKALKGQRLMGMPEGRQMKIMLEVGIALDLFMPVIEDYYRILAIRTGSADYAHKKIAAAWVAKGWCGVKGEGLRQIKDCVKSKSGDWILVNKKGHRPPVWNSELEFFKWLGVEYINPVDREVYP